MTVDFDFALALDDVDANVRTREPNTFWKEVAYEGVFHKDDQRIDITPKWMDHWKQTFAAMSADGVEVPVPLEHTRNPEKRRGTVIGMRRQLDSKGRDSLWAKFKFRDDEAAKLALSSGASIFVPKVAKSGTGKCFEKPVEHIAITDYPVIPDLEPFQAIVLSFDESKHERHPKGDAKGGEFAPKAGKHGTPKKSGVAAQKSVKDLFKGHPPGKTVTVTIDGPEGKERYSRRVYGGEIKYHQLLDDDSTVRMKEDDEVFELSSRTGTNSIISRAKRKAGEDDVTLKDLAAQAGVDPNLPDDQIILALSKVVASARPAPPVAPPSPFGMPPRPQMAPPPMAPRPFGMSLVTDEDGDEIEEISPLSGTLLSMVKRSRQTEINRLFTERKLLPYVKAELEKKYLQEDALQFSHVPQYADDFDSVVALLDANGPVVPAGRSGPQARIDGAIALSKNENDEMSSILMKDVERRQKEFTLAQR